MKKVSLLALLVLTSYKAQASEITSNSLMVEKVEQAIGQLQQTKRKNWAYQVSHYENEEGDITQSIESYNPLRPSSEHWILLSIGGKAPTQKQQQKFMADKNKPTEKDKNSLQIRLDELIQLDTLEIKTVDPTQFTASFDVYLERLGDKASKSLTGLLTYDRTQEFIRHIEISNKDLFSPVLTAEITEFNLLLSFKKLNDRILPHEKNMQMKGSFAFFTEIDEVSTVTYSNYQYIGNTGSVEE